MRWLVAICSLTYTSTALADVPNVATDVAPVHSLVASVMGDLGTPDLILPPGADPHHFQLRPSQMRTLSNADLVVWVGPALTPWLEDVLHKDAVTGRQELELLNEDLLPMVIEGMDIKIKGEDHDYGHDDHDEHDDDHEEGHDDHADEHDEHEDGHDDHADEHDAHEESHEDHADAHDDHEEGHDDHADDHAGHDHGPIDPHIWLDPINAVHFLEEIAESLSELDPENAATYHANAEQAQAQLTNLVAELSQDLAPLHDAMLIPYHDAYKYFFARFDLTISGTLSGVDGSSPSAARVSEIRDILADAESPCLFTEPGANEKLIASALPNNKEAVISHLDALGATLTPGPMLYETVIKDMAVAIAACK